MDDSEACMNQKRTNTGSGAPSRDDLTSTYTELNIRKVEHITNTQADGLDPTYSQLNLRQNELHIAKEEETPIASGPGDQAGPHKLESKENIGNRPCRKVCLFRLVTSALITIVAGLSIYLLQIRWSQSICEQNYQIFCQFLTSNRELACSQDWIRNKDRCYLISNLETSYDEAKKYCSKFHAMLLEINSEEEKDVVPKSLVSPARTYWIGKCENGEEASSLMFRDNTGMSLCGNCDSDGLMQHCKREHRFICEKRAHLFKDIPEVIRDLCQHSLGPN
ncbi:killer cell lectin-like receptor subfamily B member 1B allele B [Hypanus sabinus]|uniref:killer cell lectin-like receptor subfamily B member 1B allele B n=1 Tax=Hypanus sabinus TaxID=79690 RepID=UPI0028C4FBCD|nr:killer cell lectin-like receptor subfamily B member 1B allele B [Hypanus sabinus]